MQSGWEPAAPQPQIHTFGDWPTEKDSETALDEILTRIDAFYVHRQISGYPLQPRLDSDLQKFRIDRILIPKPHLVALGWNYGPIGIEVKKSGEKIGPAISQMLDYSRALWKIDTIPGVWFALQCVFLWPLQKTHGTIASILNQQRLGSADTGAENLLRLSSGEQVLARFTRSGAVRIGQVLNGRKAGHR